MNVNVLKIKDIYSLGLEREKLIAVENIIASEIVYNQLKLPIVVTDGLVEGEAKETVNGVTKVIRPLIGTYIVVGHSEEYSTTTTTITNWNQAVDCEKCIDLESLYNSHKTDDCKLQKIGTLNVSSVEQLNALEKVADNVIVEDETETKK